jgi:hypothetical protein
MRTEIPQTPPEPTPGRRDDEVVVILHYPRNTELLQIHDDMDQIGRRLIAFADGSYEAIRLGRT